MKAGTEKLALHTTGTLKHISLIICLFLAIGLYITPCAFGAGNTGSETKKKESVVKTKPKKPLKKKTTTSSGSSKKKSAGAETKKSPESAKKDSEKEKAKLEAKRVQWIEKTLQYGINSDRIDAINKIQNIKAEKDRKKLLKMVTEIIENETDSSVTVKAISVSAEMKNNDAINAIVKRIEDPLDDVRIEAVYALKKLKAKSAEKKVLAVLKKEKLDKDSNYTQALIQLLADFHSRGFIDEAQKAIEDNATTTSIREDLVLYLGKTDSKKVVPFLKKIFLDEEENITIRSLAVHSLGTLKATETIGDIKNVLKTIESYPFKKKRNYFKLRIYCISALVKLGDDSAVPELISSLRSDNANVRLRAIKLMKELKDKRTIDILKYKMKYDPDEKVREEAREVLKDMGVEIPDESDK